MAHWSTKLGRQISARMLSPSALLPLIVKNGSSTVIRIVCNSLAMIAILGLFSFAPSLFAESGGSQRSRLVQLPVSESDDLRFKHLSIKDGLSQTRVEQIVQDDQGFMWFGTQYGLNRYDGHTYRVFAHDPNRANSLGGVYIRSLFKDRDGKLWIACNKSLDRFDPVTETFTHITLLPLRPATIAPTITNIAQREDGTLWLSSTDGLYKLSRQGQLVQRYNHVPGDHLSLSSNDVQSVSVDRERRLWICTRNGLNLFDADTGRVLDFIPLPDSYLGLRLHEDHRGNLWLLFGPSSAIGQLNPTDHTVTRVIPRLGAKPTPADETITAMLEDRDGIMWFGTNDSGLLKYDESRKRFLRYRNQLGDPDSLAASRVTTLFQGREGTFWIGHHQTEPSFFSANPYAFESFKQKLAGRNSLRSDLTTSVFRDRNNALWIGTTGMLQRFDRRSGSSTVVSGPVNGTDTLTMLQDDAHTFWFGTATSGVIKTDEQQRTTKVYRTQASNPATIASDHVQRLLVDRAGTLWAATWDGLSRFDREHDTFESFRRNLEGGSVNYLAIAEDSTGMIWLGSALGLERFDPKTKVFSLYPDAGGRFPALSDNRVNAILFDSLGRAWIGTQNGLDVLDLRTRKITRITTKDGLSGNVVSCILDDDHGNMWLSTNRGITRVVAATYRFSTFGTEDGLPGNDLSGWGACSKAPDGEMFFGGFSGTAAFWPGNIVARLSDPNVRLTDFQVEGIPVEPTAKGLLQKAIGFTDSVTLEHGQASFAIAFASVNFDRGSEARYRYRLVGLDKRWNEIEQSQAATYTTLPTGFYTFQVQVATGTGGWFEPGARVDIRVLPAWWNTWLFRLVCIGAVVVSFILFHRYRMQKIGQDYKIRLEERLRERTRIARELHDTLLQSFQGLILSFHTSVQRLHPEEPARQAMERTLDDAQQAMLEGRDSLLGLRFGYEASLGLEGSLSLLLEALRANSHVTFTLKSTGSLPACSESIPRELLAIAKEALRNALTHSGATEVEVCLQQSTSDLQLRIRDNGCGIGPQELRQGGLNGHWGIVGMRERARQIGGSLSVANLKDSGTEVLFRASLQSQDALRRSGSQVVREHFRRWF